MSSTYHEDGDTVKEVSAGIITLKKASGDRRYLLLRHENGGHWSFPKGHLEEGETAKEAAVRELYEETRLEVFEFVNGFRREINYSYKREGRKVAKSVIYFLAFVPRDLEVNLSPEHLDFIWLPYREARKRLTYGNDQRLLDRAEVKLKKGCYSYEG
ncbi:NUDIX domain-containing protein [Candidatus Bipolaricaulota bacterium]|nr:NUDIX domain-containing protein [Candidatus Bipolaricaulota bacterium]MBS3814126.1 NUDIX domain-containing protein [Candidatus Bipolaricaulota bacterium]MBS3825236.1 NUDIX domain-containing protein [Candidatus Bipolaricaulota bacterium]